MSPLGLWNVLSQSVALTGISSDHISQSLLSFLMFCDSTPKSHRKFPVSVHFYVTQWVSQRPTKIRGS